MHSLSVNTTQQRELKVHVMKVYLTNTQTPVTRCILRCKYLACITSVMTSLAKIRDYITLN